LELSACFCEHEGDGLAHGTNSYQVECGIERFTPSPQDIGRRDTTSVALQYNQDNQQLASASTPWLKSWEVAPQASSIIRDIGQGRASYCKM
jgi:hypothetical protein